MLRRIGEAGERKEDRVLERGAEAVDAAVRERRVDLDAERALLARRRARVDGESGEAGDLRGERARADARERDTKVRADVHRVGYGADDLAEEDAIDAVVGVEAEVVD